jgi:hypothetical protein
MTAITHSPPAGPADTVPPDVFRETMTRFAGSVTAHFARRQTPPEASSPARDRQARPSYTGGLPS